MNEGIRECKKEGTKRGWDGGRNGCREEGIIE
jgi:hypothetical protein